MKRVISFCLYKAPNNWESIMETTHNKYLLGLSENIKLLETFYPGWYMYIYHNKELDKSLIDRFSSEYVKFIEVNTTETNAMQWRFFPIDDEDVELFISRDIDSRITEREKVSVHEWIDSDKIIHIMRDHPHHGYTILGGMWGMKKTQSFNMKDSCKNYNISKNFEYDKHWFDKWWDMNFLAEVIYPKFKESSYINTSYNCMESWCKPFTLPMEDKHFVGEIYKETGEREYHYNLL